MTNAVGMISQSAHRGLGETGSPAQKHCTRGVPREAVDEALGTLLTLKGKEHDGIPTCCDRVRFHRPFPAQQSLDQIS